MPDSPNINSPASNITSDVKGEKLSNGNLFNVFISLDNHSQEEPYKLPSEHIIELVIEENLLSWPYKGYLIYNNKYEGIERNRSDSAWFYRMDARDEIRIQISIKDDEIEFPKETWEIDIDCIVYDSEDIVVPNIANKQKKIYFWDKRYQMMMDKKIYWSTVVAQNLKNASHMTDQERGMYIGEAIKALLSQENGAGYPEFIDEDNWDKGGTFLNYVSPAQNSIADDLNYLLDIHSSEEGDDRAILKYNNRIDKKWQLIPLYKLFDNAGSDPNQPGKWQLEHYFFEDAESDKEDTTPYRAPYLNTKGQMEFEIDIKMESWNRITSYEFVDMSGIDNAKALVSKPVYVFDFGENTFKMDYEQNEIEHVKTEFKTLYTDKLLPAKKAEPIFTLNKTKKNQYNVSPAFSFVKSGWWEEKKMRSHFGRENTLFAGIFLNEFISFRVPGSPHRTVGKFAGIDRRTSDAKFKFDNKICGQWLITNTKHIWNQNRYVNDIQAVKVHSYDDPGISEDVK